MWPEPEMKNRSLHSTSRQVSTLQTSTLQTSTLQTSTFYKHQHFTNINILQTSTFYKHQHFTSINILQASTFYKHQHFTNINIGSFQKRCIPPPTEEIFAVRRGREEKCLRMSEGEERNVDMFVSRFETVIKLCDRRL